MSRVDVWLTQGMDRYPAGPPWDTQKANILRLLFDTCTIQRPGLVSDGSGGKKRGMVVVVTNEPCKLDVAGGTGDVSQSQNAPLATPIITLRASAPLTPDCQIVTGGFTYAVSEVVDVDTPLVLKMAKLKRIDVAP